MREFLREVAIIGALAAGLFALAVAGSYAFGAPPPKGSEDWEILSPHAEWIRSVATLDGSICCTIADGRPVDARSRGATWQVKWRPGQLEGAPTDWIDVPEDVVIRVPNPTGFPIAFWLQGKLRCFVPPGGV